MKSSKNIIKQFHVFIIVGMLIGNTGCEDALDEKIYSFIAKENFYKNAADAESAIFGIYNGLQIGTSTGNVYDRWHWVLTGLGSDQMTIHRNATFLQMDNFNYATDNIFLAQYWEGIYAVINRANVAIARIPEIDMDVGLRNILVAEAKLMRASMYFNLVRLWGSVPFGLEEVSNEESANIPKASVDEIYAAIIRDLEEAEQILPLARESGEFARVTRGAAKSLLTDVLLTTENWSAAAAKAKEVIDLGQYFLLDNFEDIFNVNNETNSEIIYTIAYDRTNVLNFMASFYHAGGTDNANCFLGAQVVQVDEASDMWLNWSNSDPRKDYSINDTYLSRDGTIKSVYNTARPFPAVTKWNAPDEIGVRGCPLNIIVYRYADILLMYAEALSQASGPDQAAYDAFNMVRRRGYKQPIDLPSAFDLPPGLSAQEFRDSVIEERSHEFVAEGKRLFDLHRTGQFPQILIDLGKNVTPGATLFPIPQAEIDGNSSLTASDQNPGY